jgi:hypothetical protein
MECLGGDEALGKWEMEVMVFCREWGTRMGELVKGLGELL